MLVFLLFFITGSIIVLNSFSSLGSLSLTGLYDLGNIKKSLVCGRGTPVGVHRNMHVRGGKLEVSIFPPNRIRDESLGVSEMFSDVGWSRFKLNQAAEVDDKLPT